jgi:gas vesicle protein
MGKSKFGAGLIFGAILGGVAAMFLSPKSGKENREMAKEKLEEWQKKYENKPPQDIAKEVFGIATEEGKKLFETTQKMLNDKLDDLKSKADEIDQDKYKEVVKEVIAKVQKEKEATGDRAEKLKKYLLDRWEYVMSESKKDVKKIVSKAEKAEK